MAVALPQSDAAPLAGGPAPEAAAASVLEVDGLTTRFATPEGSVAAVSEVSFAIADGEAVGIVGESGSGKSQIFMSVMGLLAANGTARGRVRYRGQDILGLPPARLNRIRGSKITMIFQDPMTSLNPYLRISTQLTEVLVQHKGLGGAEALRLSVEMLERVRISEARRRIHMYPHEFSGGMRQRVMIAMSLLCQPELLIADEPTTALDVTVQAQILDLLRGLKDELGSAVCLITHDLGVIAGLADRVLVMYAGRIVEEGTVRRIFYDPRHPYTQGLLASRPQIGRRQADELPSIPGQPPDLQRLPPGCAFAPRCALAFDRCRLERPPLRPSPRGGSVACHLEPEEGPGDA